MKAKKDKEVDAGIFNPGKGKCWMFPATEVVAKAKGKVAVFAALCLLSFSAPAQDRILQRAPGMLIFEWKGDTIDTNALPAMYRLFGCDSLCALQRTAALLVAAERICSTANKSTCA